MQADVEYKVETIAGKLCLPLGRGENLPLGNKPDPTDELFFIILTTMTQYGASGAYDDLKTAFPSWEELLGSDAESRLRVVIEHCGLVNQKAPQILAIARRLHADFGRVTLEPLRDMSDSEAEAYLTSLPRVGIKVARCVLMYSLGRDVLPVDAHVLRVSRRLGLLPEDLSWAKAHNRIHEVVPEEYRYAIHVGFVEHGRIVCTHKKPDCAACVLKEECPKAQV